MHTAPWWHDRLASTVRFALLAAAVTAGLSLAGCASGPSGFGSARSIDRDGAEAHPPPDLDRVPDAEPRLEVVRPGGANKPYEQSGKVYVPLAGDPPFRERGLASWYGRKFQGRPTASGELYNMYAMTAAHPTLPIPSYVRVRNPGNGREVIVRVNDRGPFHSDRILDLSYTAALRLDLLRGVQVVEIERITYDEIRTGAWRRGGPDTTMLAAAVPATSAAAPPVGVPPAAAGVDPPAQVDPSPAAVPPAAVAASSAGDASSLAVAPASSTAPPPAVDPAWPPPPPPIASADPARAYTAAARGFWVQLGAFRQSSGATAFQHQVEQEMASLAPLLAIFDDHTVHRLQAGPYRTRGEAASAAETIRGTLRLVPVIVERR